MQGAGVGLGFEFAPDLRVTPRDPQVVDHGAHVQPRATDQHRHGVPAADVVDRGDGPGLELGHRELLGRVLEIDQMVGHLGLFGCGRSCRSYVHAPIDLHGIEGDDLRPANEPSQGNGEVRLTGGGGAYDHQWPRCQYRPIDIQATFIQTTLYPVVWHPR